MRRSGTPVRLLLLGVLPGLLCGCMAVPSPSRSTDAANPFGPSAGAGAASPASAPPGEGTPPAALPFARITAPAAPSHSRPAAVQHLDAPAGLPAESPRSESPRQPVPHHLRQNRAPVQARPPVNVPPGMCDQAEWSGQLPSGLGSSCRQMFGR